MSTRKVTPEEHKATMDFFFQCRLTATAANTGWKFLRTLVFSLRPVVTHDCPTWGVDAGWRLYMSPDWTKTKTVAQGVALLRHEVLHLLLRHCLRAPIIFEAYGVSPEEYGGTLNIAMDLVINQIPEIEKFVHDPGMNGAHHSRYPGCQPNLTLEEYFQFLLALPNPPGKTGKDGKRISGPGKGKGKGNGEGDSDSESPGVMNGDCGSGADGRPRPWELDKKDAKSPAVSEATALTSAIGAAKDMASSQMMGKMPAGIVRAIEELLHAEVDWRTELRACVKARLAAITGNGAGEINPKRLHRRSHLRHPFIRPATRNVIAKIGLFIDTSGSMGGTEGVTPLTQAAAEAYAILRECAGPTVVLSVDAAISSKQMMTAGQKLAADGGGGTDMRLGYAGLEEEDVDLGIALTDGFTPWPDVPPSYASITVLVGEQVGEAPDYMANYPHRVLHSVPQHRRSNKK